MQFVPAMPSVPIETVEVIPTFEEVTTTNMVNKPVGRVEDGKWKLSDKETIRGTDVDKILDALHAGSKYEGTVDEFKQEIYETYKSLYPGKYADANDFLKKNLQKIAKGDGLMMPLVPQNYEELDQLVDDSEKQVGTKSEQWWKKYGQDIAVAFDERDPAGFEKKLKAASPNLGRYAQQIRDLGPVRWMKYANGVVQRMGGIEALRRTASPLELEMVKLLAQVTIQDREFALKGEQWLAEEGLLEKKGQLIDAQIGLAQAEARKALMGGGNNEMMKYVIQRMKMEGTGPYAFGRALKDPMVRGALTAAAEQFAASLAATGINFEWVEKKFRAGPGWAAVGPLFGWGAPHEKLRVPEVRGELTQQQQQEAINRALQNLTPAQREKYGAMIGQMMQ